MNTEDKVTEIFCMVDDFCKFFEAMSTKYTLKTIEKRNITQMEHSKHRGFDNFIVNLLGVIVLIVCFQRSHASMHKRPLTHSLHYSEFVELTLL